MAEILGTYVLGTDTISTIEAGVQNENDASCVKFDYSDWKEEYGDGILSMRIQRREDDDPYPVLLTVSTDPDDGENVMVWSISDVDTAQIGKHKAQLTYTVDGVRKKTTVFLYRIVRSVVSGDTVPDPYDDWLEDLESMASDMLDDGAAIVNEAKGYRNEASGYATAASGSATSASNSASDSEAYAKGTRGGTAIDSDDPAYHKNSKYYSEQAATSASNASDSASAANTAKESASDYAGQAYLSSESASGYASNASSSATDAYGFATNSAGHSQNSEAWAKGTRGGTAVGSDDPAYHNNSKYFSEQASASATAAAGSATTASDSATAAAGSATAAAASVSSLAPAYSSSATYDVGDYVLYSGSLYRCTTAITTAEEWTAAHWTAAKMSEDVSDLKSDLTISTGIEMFHFTDGMFIQTVNVNQTANLTPLNASGMSYALADCVEGDLFTISGTPYDASTRSIYMFVDENNKCVQKSTVTAAITNKILQAPVTGKLIVNVLRANAKMFCSNIPNLYDQIVTLANKQTEESDFSFGDIFKKLESDYVDDFYPRQSFVDENHPYEVFGDSSVVPTMQIGVGAFTQNASANVLYVKPFDAFPHFVAVGHMTGAVINFPLYVDAPTGLTYIYIASTGAVQYSGVTHGSLSTQSKWYLFRILKNGVYVYDDIGTWVFVPAAYIETKPMNCGMWFGTAANRIYGYGSWVEWNVEDLNSYNMNKVIEYHSQKMKYTHNNTVYNDIDQNPYVSIVQNNHSNNPCLQFICNWSDESYRVEASIREPAANLYNEQGMLQRFKFSADYFVSSNNLEGGYRTYIFQIHDGGFAADGWVDPPPVHVHFENGSLYAEICYIENGEIPTGSTPYINDQYLLGELPYDEWFTLEVEARISWRDGMMPYVRICLNGSEKLNISTPVGFNIPSSGGFTDIQFGSYNPQWKGGGGAYTNKARTILATNIKFEF